MPPIGLNNSNPSSQAASTPVDSTETKKTQPVAETPDTEAGRVAAEGEVTQEPAVAEDSGSTAAQETQENSSDSDGFLQNLSHTTTSDTSQDFSAQKQVAYDGAEDPLAEIQRQFDSTFNFDQTMKEAQAGDPAARQRLANYTAFLNQRAQTTAKKLDESRYEGKSEKECDKETAELIKRADQEVIILENCAKDLRGKAKEMKEGSALSKFFLAEAKGLKSSAQELAKKTAEKTAGQDCRRAEEASKSLKSLVQKPSLLQQAVVKKDAKILDSLKGKMGELKNLGNGLVAKNGKFEKTGPAPQAAKNEAEQKAEGGSKNEQLAKEGAAQAKDTSLEKPSPEMVKKAEAAVMAQVPAEVRKARLEAQREKDKKIELARAGFSKASDDMEALEGRGGGAALLAGARQLCEKVKVGYRRSQEQAYEDMLAGKDSLRGLVFCDSRVRSMFEGKGVEETAAASEGALKAADILAAGPHDLKNKEKLAEVFKAKQGFKSDFDGTVLGYFAHWKPRSERELMAADLRVHEMGVA